MGVGAALPLGVDATLSQESFRLGFPGFFGLWSGEGPGRGSLLPLTLPLADARLRSLVMLPWRDTERGMRDLEVVDRADTEN